MKKITLLLLLFCTSVAFSQDYTGVLDLLLRNKREEARKLFDKQFSKTKETNIDLLFLDVFLNEQMGQLDFDENLIGTIEKLPNSEQYVQIFANNNAILGNITKDPANDLTYKKIDKLAASPKFKNLSIVKYRKATLDKKRFQMESAKQLFKELGQIEQWQFCGVFENLNGSGLEIEYEPEAYPKSDKIFDANSNGKVSWYIPLKPQSEGYHVFANESEYGSGIMYAQTFVESAEKKEYLLSFGAKLGLKIFLNDREIYFNSEISNANLDAYTIRIPLEKGYNRLLFKIEIGSGSDYFSAQLKNKDGALAQDLKFSPTFQPYPQLPEGTEIAAAEIKSDFESYFDNLVKSDPNNVLYRLYQFNAYEINSKKVEALESLEGLNEKYPNSSIIASYLMRYYNLLDDDAEKVNEITKNIENSDVDYYLVPYLKLTDREWLTSSPIQELEKYRDKSRKYKNRFAEQMYDFMIISRKADIDGMISSLDKIIVDSHHNEKLEVLAATFYARLKNDSPKTVSLLEALTQKADNYEANDWLLNYYNEMNRKDDIKRIRLKRIENYNYFNSFRSDYIQMLIDENQYEKALELADENLKYFPYSFTNLEKKARIYTLMKNDKEAERNIRQSLIYNSGNGSLRKTLYDLTKTPDEIEEIATKDIYKVIKDRRKSTLKTDYGVVVLLDEFIVNVLPEGGRKSKVIFLYEVTSESGIEEMKEYQLSSSSNNLIKSEIVKPDGSIVPAEEGDGMLVFANLKVGDVIYIEYDTNYNNVGRFFKDFNISAYFNSSYPSVETSFTLIAPSDKKYNAAFNNGNIAPIVKKINNKTCTTWKRNNTPAIQTMENYGPVFNDLANSVFVGTIGSWNDISNWYADLVKKNLKVDKITKDTFNVIFPSGTTGLTQRAIAEKIYAYIETNITYSSLDFRQSGYVPQKPSKTITTKLGDCKDVSTLFVALAQLANLKANLVLVSTNDNGLKVMPLPSNDFNHCIVKVVVDGNEMFLELTDKFLPFGALPVTLYNAKALVIPFDKNEKVAPISIPFDQSAKSIRISETTVTIDDKAKTFANKQTVHGALKSYYNELFAASTTEEMRKLELEKDYNSKLNKVVALQSSKLIPNQPFDNNLTFETQFTVAEKPQSVGSLKITNIPFLDRIHSRDVITQETRNYDIMYDKYEDSFEYHSVVILNIPEGKAFTEFPENRTTAFKGHSYALKLELIKPNSLKITRDAVTPWNTIAVADYPEFKKYVEEIIESEEKIIGYK